MAVASLYMFLIAVVFTVCASAATTPSTNTKGLNWTFGTALVNNVKDAWLDFVAPKLHNIPVMPEMTNEPLPGVHINMTDITLASVGVQSKYVDIAIKKDSTAAGGAALDISATNVCLNITFNIEVTIGSFKPHVATGWFDFDQGADLSLGLAPAQFGDYFGLTDSHFTFNPNGFKLHTTSEFINILLDLSKGLVEKLVATTMEGQITGLFKKLEPVWSTILPDIKLTKDIGLNMAFASLPLFNTTSGDITGSHVARFMELPGRTFPPVEEPLPLPTSKAGGDNIQLFIDQSLFNSGLYLFNSGKLIHGYLDQARLSKLGAGLPIQLTSEGIHLLFPDISTRMPPDCEVSIAFETLDPYPLVGFVAGGTIFNISANLKVYGGLIAGKTISDPKECLADKSCVLMSSMDISIELGLIIDADISGNGNGVDIQVVAVQINSLEKSKVDPVPGDNSNFPAIQNSLNHIIDLLIPTINTKIGTVLGKLAEAILPVAEACGISLKNLTLDAAYGYATVLAEPTFAIPPSYDKCFGIASDVISRVPDIISGAL